MRELSVCRSVWFSGTGTYRGVVDMHTFKVNSQSLARIGDSVSQSITLNDAILYANGSIGAFYGIDYGTGKCRLGGPSGPSSSCSTPNTAVVSYYGVGYDGSGPAYTCVFKVSWRDDRGLAHTANQSTAPGLKACSPSAA